MCFVVLFVAKSVVLLYLQVKNRHQISKKNVVVLGFGRGGGGGGKRKSFGK